MSKKPNIGILITLSSIPIIMVLGNSMLIPVLPTIGSLLNLSSFKVSLLITLFSIPAALVIPFAGVISDRIGRKKVITTGLILYGLGGLMAGFTPLLNNSYLFLLTARIIQGIGAAGTAPIAMVLVGDLYQKESRSQALGVIEASNAMGKVVSPIFGSLLGLLAWYAMFFVFPFLVIPIIIFLWKLIEEPTSEKEPQPLSIYKEHIQKIFKKQGKWLTVAFYTGMMTMFTAFGILFYLSNFLEDVYHIDGFIKGLVLAIPLLGLCLTAYFTGTYIKKHTAHTKKAILLGIALLTITTASIPWIKNSYLLIGIIFANGIGSGLILPCLNLLVTSAVGVQERGVITSLYGSVRFLGVALGPPIFGLFLEKPLLLYIATGSFLALNFVLACFFIHRPKKLSGSNTEHSRLFIKKGQFPNISTKR